MCYIAKVLGGCHALNPGFTSLKRLEHKTADTLEGKMIL